MHPCGSGKKPDGHARPASPRPGATCPDPRRPGRLRPFNRFGVFSALPNSPPRGRRIARPGFTRGEML
jgi:hypothetical protein